MRQEHTKPSARKCQLFIKKRYREKKEEEPTLFHIVSGTSIGAINAAILVSYVKENKTWEGSGQRLIDFWKYLSTHSAVENMNPYFEYHWNFWHTLDESIASGESARRYYSTKEFIIMEFPTCLGQKYQNQIIDSLIHQTLGMFMITNH
jgi:hypothetical protein